MQQNQLLPFRYNTRQKRLKIGTASFELGASRSITLPEVGYLARIFLFFSGSVTYSAGSTPADLAPYSIFKRISVTLNNAATDIYNVSGYGTFLVNSILTKMGRLDQQPEANFYAYPVSGSSQAFNLGLQIPIADSQGMNFEAGLINLQAPEVQCQINIDFANALTEIGDNITALSGTVHAYYEYYEVPSPTRVMQPPVILHRIIEQVTPVSQTGDVIYTVPRGGQLKRLIHTLRLNGARSDSFDEHSIRFNQSETVYKQEKRLTKLLSRERYGYNLPTGVIPFDVAYAMQKPEESDLRDAINTERITTLDSIVTVSSGASLGTGNNFLVSIREILQAAQPV